MPLDRQLQKDLLLRMRAEYPHGVFFHDLPGEDGAKTTNLLYLAEHGLCDAGIRFGIGGGIGYSESTITARGLDFLEDDGGLSAILGVVTVKLHGETIRALLASKIETLDLPHAEKSFLRRQIETLPATVLQAATLHLVNSGLSHLPNPAVWLRGLLGAG